MLAGLQSGFPLSSENALRVNMKLAGLSLGANVYPALLNIACSTRSVGTGLNWNEAQDVPAAQFVPGAVVSCGAAPTHG